MSPARRRAEAMAIALPMEETTVDGWRDQVEAMSDLAKVLDAYFAHTRFVRRVDIGDGFTAVGECRLKPEPIE